MKITVDAAAKINLSLDIKGRLENGYHDLFMIMQSVSVYDTVTVERTSNKEIELTCSEQRLPCDSTNIAYKAAVAFFEETKTINDGVKIHIEKRIPFAAGLAGGSADGAAVIYALNRLYNTELSEEALCSIGLKVGSDVPFCITGGTRLVEGTGEKLTALPDLGSCYIVLAKPDEGVSTAKAYGDFDKAQSIIHPNNEAMLEAVKNGDYKGICTYGANVFEQVINLPEFASIKKELAENGADLTCMSGSGPTIFGLFSNENDAKNAENALRSKNICSNVFVCTPVCRGVTIK